ncbi:hypothetical protein BDV93DRAFT_560724 [Ceratobasidium sp. AG-I]|nr:hypothetical protein BDV93DRAFT_560724 [Ceratobasidium sp. AG-I]
MTSSPYLFFDFTSPSKESFAATRTIKSLIDVVATDVCALRRNTRVSYNFLELASNLWTEINKLIEIVDQGDSDWDNYDRYVAAIDPLEEILLKFCSDADDERDRYLASFASIVDCVSFVDQWERSRSNLRESFGKLHTEQHFLDLKTPPNDVEKIQQQDDIAFLSDLVAATKSHPAAAKVKPPTLIMDIEPQLENIRSQLQLTLKSPGFPDNSLVIIIKCAMIVYGAMELIGRGGLDKNSTSHIASQTVWGAAKILLEHAGEHAKNPTEPTHEQLKTEYDAFVKNLTGAAKIKLPDSYASLLKFVGKIGRSYHAQAILLVTLCRDAAKYFETENNQTDDNFSALERAFNKTADALRASVSEIAQATTTQHALDSTSTQNDGTTFGSDGHVSELGGATVDATARAPSSDPTKAQASDQELANLFFASAKEIAQCFQDIGLKDQADPEKRLKAAETKDKQQVSRVNKKLRKPSAEAEPLQLISLLVNVHGAARAGEIYFTTKMLLRPSTRLSAVRWSLSTAPKLAEKSLMTKSHFEREDVGGEENRVVSLDTTISSLEKAGQVKLRLIMEN